MKVQSNVYPREYYIRKIDLGNAYIKLRKNIVEKEIESGESKDTIYEYDEVEIVITNRTNIENYLNEYFDELFEMGLKKENEVPEPTIEERIQVLELIELERILGGM